MISLFYHRILNTVMAKQSAITYFVSSTLSDLLDIEDTLCDFSGVSSSLEMCDGDRISVGGLSIKPS